MTPERKKKLRLLLRRKAAEELKRQQEAKANERRRIIAERTGQKKQVDTLSECKYSMTFLFKYLPFDLIAIETLEKKLTHTNQYIAY